MMDELNDTSYGAYNWSVESLQNLSVKHNMLPKDFNIHHYINNHTFPHLLFPFDCPSMGSNIGNHISMVLYLAVCIIGLFGNTLVIYVVLRFSKMQTVTNLYILMLAIADECFLIGIPFLLITMHLGEWIFGEWLCKAYMVSTSITQFTSSIFLLIMAGDRFLAVCHPISSPRFRTPMVSKIVSGVAWCTSVVLMLPVMIYSTTIKREDSKMTCNMIWGDTEFTNSTEESFDESDGTTFIWYTLILGFAIPLSLILIFYYLVLRKLRNVGPKTKSKEKKRSHRKVTKLVLTVIMVYVLCWLPYWILQISLINSPPDNCKSKLEITIFVLVGCLGYSNSSMNPILYAFLSDNFKKSFMKACSCAKRKDINAQLQVEHSFFPRFGRSRSDRVSSKSILKNNASIQVSNINQSTKTGNCTVESMMDVTYNGNGHNNGSNIYLGVPKHHNNNKHPMTDDESDGENTKHSSEISVIKTELSDHPPFQARPPVLHTDL